VFALASGDVGEARHPQRHSETWGGQLDGAEEWSIRDGSDVDPPLASPFRRITATRLRGFPDAAQPCLTGSSNSRSTAMRCEARKSCSTAGDGHAISSAARSVSPSLSNAPH